MKQNKRKLPKPYLKDKKFSVKLNQKEIIALCTVIEIMNKQYGFYSYQIVDWDDLASARESLRRNKI